MYPSSKCYTVIRQVTNFVVDDVLRNASSGLLDSGAEFPLRTVLDLRYVDNIALLSTTAWTIQSALDGLVIEAS